MRSGAAQAAGRLRRMSVRIESLAVGILIVNHKDTKDTKTFLDRIYGIHGMGIRFRIL